MSMRGTGTCGHSAQVPGVTHKFRVHCELGASGSSWAECTPVPRSEAGAQPGCRRRTRVAVFGFRVPWLCVRLVYTVLHVQATAVACSVCT